MILRDYQQECVDIVDNIGEGSYLINMATGLGKTATFTNFKRCGRTLVLAHREELIEQPRKYFDCPTGIEMGKIKSNGEPVVIASVQSLVNRVDKFNPYEFDRIITDEAHHAVARSYRKIYDYFECRQHIGVTATPNRDDKTGLENIFSDIIFERNLKWGIKNNYLSDIECIRCQVDYDLTSVATRLGDFVQKELEEAMDGTAGAIAEIYKTKAIGQTLIFATSVKHCYDIAELIEGSVVVEAKTKDRGQIIDDFTNRKISCIINCMIFTEGTDIPLIETVIIARPTKNISLYTQMVGRGLRLYPGKEKLLLIDCVGASENNLCTAPSLIGLSIKDLNKKQQDEVEGDLFDLEDLIVEKADNIKNWIVNTYHVDLWAKKQDYNLRDMNLFKMPNGDLTCIIKGAKYTIPCQDELGFTILGRRKVPMQQALDRLYTKLNTAHQDQEHIWSLNIAKKWGKAPASEKQINLIKRRLKGQDVGELTKLEASQALNRLLCKTT